MSNAIVTKNLIRESTCDKCKYYKFDVDLVDIFAKSKTRVVQNKKNECCRRLIVKMKLPKVKTCKWWTKIEWNDPDWPRT